MADEGLTEGFGAEKVAPAYERNAVSVSKVTRGGVPYKAYKQPDGTTVMRRVGVSEEYSPADTALERDAASAGDVRGSVRGREMMDDADYTLSESLERGADEGADEFERTMGRLAEQRKARGSEPIGLESQAEAVRIANAVGLAFDFLIPYTPDVITDVAKREVAESIRKHLPRKWESVELPERRAPISRAVGREALSVTAGRTPIEESPFGGPGLSSEAIAKNIRQLSKMLDRPMRPHELDESAFGVLSESERQELRRSGHLER